MNLQFSFSICILFSIYQWSYSQEGKFEKMLNKVLFYVNYLELLFAYWVQV